MKKISYTFIIVGAFALLGAACTSNTSTVQPAESNTTFENGPSTGERAAGEYLGFDILTFRHDPTYYDETDEYIEIQWLGPGQVNMEGYKLIGTSADLYEYTFTFPDVVLNEGEIITVYTQPGSGRLSFGYNGEIWVDDESEVRLYDPNEYLEAYYGD